MPTIKQIVEDRDTKAGLIFDYSIQILIVISLINFSWQTMQNLSESTRAVLRYIQVGTVIIFTIEYLLRIIVAGNKLKYIFSFFGLIDLVAILPFYISTGIDLRSLRAFRLLRLFRILKLVRYSKALQRFHNAFVIAKEEIVLFFTVTVMLLYLAGVGIYYFESNAQPDVFTSVFQSLWWAVATLTTVGYGDIYPITIGGKIFTAIVLFIGLGIVAVPSGLVATALSKAREIEEKSDR
jgi:voltage-gated potassium channel